MLVVSSEVEVEEDEDGDVGVEETLGVVLFVRTEGSGAMDSSGYWNTLVSICNGYGISILSVTQVQVSASDGSSMLISGTAEEEEEEDEDVVDVVDADANCCCCLMPSALIVLLSQSSSPPLLCVHGVQTPTPHLGQTNRLITSVPLHTSHVHVNP